MGPRLGPFTLGKLGCSMPFQMRCLRKILRIKWYRHIPNFEVLRRVNIPTILSIFKVKRLRWLGHVHRMDQKRLPSVLLYSELSSGERNIGRPKARFKDMCKLSLKDLKIDHTNWE